MKLYILPYYYYENYFKDTFNIFRRDYNLYQYEDRLFLFYNTYNSLLKYDNMFNGLSSDINNYKFDLSLPQIAFNYQNPYFVLMKYKGEFDLVKVICPNNEFMVDEFKYILNRLNVESFIHVEENEFENKEIMFFETFDGVEVKTGIGTTIYYNIFLTYLNHLVNMFFLKSTIMTSMNLYKLLVYLDIKEQILSDRVKKISLIDGNTILAYKILNERLIKNKDNNLYTIQNWKDRYISHKYFEGIILNIDGEIFTTEEKIDKYEIISINKSNKILQESLISLETQLPQSIIKKTIDEYELLEYNENEAISNIPNWNITYFDLKDDLIISKNIIASCVNQNEDYKNMIIKENLRIIINKLEKTYKNNGLPLGVCPECNKGYIWQSNKGYYCDNCEKFVLWNKTLETKLGFIPNKYQVKHMLNNKRMFTIKNRKYKLIEYISKENKIWNIIKLND